MRAVTGWPDARDGKLLSIFEAMKRGLIADTRVIRLLEAQIATGGIIDPRQHHRVPINIAFRRGLFNKELNDKLEDTTDDTKGIVQKYDVIDSQLLLRNNRDLNINTLQSLRNDCYITAIT